MNIKTNPELVNVLTSQHSVVLIDFNKSVANIEVKHNHLEIEFQDESNDDEYIQSSSIETKTKPVFFSYNIDSDRFQVNKNGTISLLSANEHFNQLTLCVFTQIVFSN